MWSWTGEAKFLTGKFLGGDLASIYEMDLILYGIRNSKLTSTAMENLASVKTPGVLTSLRA